MTEPTVQIPISLAKAILSECDIPSWYEQGLRQAIEAAEAQVCRCDLKGSESERYICDKPYQGAPGDNYWCKNPMDDGSECGHDKSCHLAPSQGKEMSE